MVLKARLPGILLLFFVIALLVLSGCDIAKKVLPKRCPATCDDQNTCTLDICNKDTNYLCTNQKIAPCDGNKVCEQGEYLNSTDCPNCDDTNKCTIDKYNYSSGECSYEYLSSCCGNTVCEASESTSTCAVDCPSCDDQSACTVDTYDKVLRVCDHKPIIPCCGNNRCEFGENFSRCNSDCEPSEAESISLCGTNESCVTTLSLKFKDPSVCANAASIGGTDSCYKQVALETNRSSICASISTDAGVHDCQEDFAVRYLNPALCPRVNPNNCFERIAMRASNVDLCNNMVEQFVKTRDDFVIKCRANVNRDFLTCKQIIQTWIADKCYTELAVAFKDVSLCNAVRLDKQTCEFYVEDAILGIESPADN